MTTYPLPKTTNSKRGGESKRMELSGCQEVNTSLREPTNDDDSPSPLKIKSSKIYAEDISHTLYLNSSPKRKQRSR